MKKVLTIMMVAVVVVSIGLIPSGAASSFKLTGKYGGDGGLTLLSWNEYPNAESYRIQMRYHGDTKWTTLFKYENDKFSFQQMRPRDSEKYQYRVVAVIGKKGYSTNKLTIKGQGIVEVDEMFEKMLRKKSSIIAKTDTTSNEKRQPEKIDETKVEQQTNVITKKDVEELAKDAFDLLNQERINAGLSTVIWNNDFAICTKIRAEELSIKFSHERPNPTNIDKDWLKNTNGIGYYNAPSVADELGISYNWIMENASSGKDTAEWVIKSWMNSDGHRDNILTRTHTRGAISCYIDTESRTDEFGDYESTTFYWVLWLDSNP